VCWCKSHTQQCTVLPLLLLLLPLLLLLRVLLLLLLMVVLLLLRASGPVEACTGGVCYCAVFLCSYVLMFFLFLPLC